MFALVVKMSHGNNNNNNIQTFYFQANWGRLEIKSHDQKKHEQNKSEKEGGT
jgi:hypothetical protein